MLPYVDLTYPFRSCPDTLIGPGVEQELHRSYTTAVSRQSTPMEPAGDVQDNLPGQPQDDNASQTNNASQTDNASRTKEAAPSHGVADIEEERRQRMAANQQLIESLGLDKPPAAASKKPTARPKPKPLSKPASRPPPSDRQLRGRYALPLQYSETVNSLRETGTKIRSAHLTSQKTMLPPHPRPRHSRRMLRLLARQRVRQPRPRHNLTHLSSLVRPLKTLLRPLQNPHRLPVHYLRQLKNSRQQRSNASYLIKHPLACPRNHPYHPCSHPYRPRSRPRRPRSHPYRPRSHPCRPRSHPYRPLKTLRPLINAHHLHRRGNLHQHRRWYRITPRYQNGWQRR